MISELARRDAERLSSDERPHAVDEYQRHILATLLRIEDLLAEGVAQSKPKTTRTRKGR